MARPHGANRDRAGGRVLAEQRALRAAQYFNGFDVDEVVDHRALPRAVDAIDVEPDGGFDAKVVRRAADAANAEVRRRRGLTATDDQGRHVLLQVPDVLDTGLLDLGA